MTKQQASVVAVGSKVRYRGETAVVSAISHVGENSPYFTIAMLNGVVVQRVSYLLAESVK